jgi:hypothetical protein
MRVKKRKGEFSMKNVFKVLWIIALVAVIGFSMAACDDGGGSGGSTVQETSGRLTITGLNSFNGKFAVAMQDNDGELMAAADLNASSQTMKGGKVENGSVTLKVWKVTGTTTASNYAGSDANVAFMVLILDNESFNESSASPIGVGAVSVTFTNGVGSGSYTSMF